MENSNRRPPRLSAGGRHTETARDTDFTTHVDEAQKFLTALDETEEVFCFQVFPEKPNGKINAAHKHGTLESLQKWLESNNRAAAGVFVCINETDGKGRIAKSIIRPRAVYADFDTPGAFQKTKLPLEPHIVVESSPGKFHAYWLVGGLPLDQFEGVQRAIIAKLGTDPQVTDLPRVMRLPGFYHQKGAPFLVTCRVNAFQPYTPEQILEAFPPVKKTESRNNDKFEDNGKVREPGRNSYLTSEAGKLRRMGLDPADIFYLLLKRNREKCEPPLETVEVRKIAKNIGRYEPENEAPKGYQLIDYSELLDAQPVNWLVKGWLKQRSVAMMFGDSSAGKSLTALDMGLSVASGVDWHGVKVKSGMVVYICGEGLDGFKCRVKAWNITYTPDKPAFILGLAVPLCDELATFSVASAIRERNLNPALIIIDTLARNYGGNEQATEDMNKFVKHIDYLRDAFGSTILIVHHTGHNNKERARGAYSLNCAIDTEIRVDKDPNEIVTLTPTKMRDGDYPKSRSFKLKRVNIGIADEDGNPVDSVILEPTEYTPPDTSNLGGNQAQALDILRGLFKCHRRNLEDGEYPGERARVTRKEFYEAWKEQRFDRQRGYEALQGLIKRGVINFHEHFIELDL